MVVETCVGWDHGCVGVGLERYNLTSTRVYRLQGNTLVVFVEPNPGYTFILQGPFVGTSCCPKHPKHWSFSRATPRKLRQLAATLDSGSVGRWIYKSVDQALKGAGR